MKRLFEDFFNLLFCSGTYGRFKLSAYIAALRRYHQRVVRGWDDSDTWNLDKTVSEFVLPRLKRFKELNDGTPGTLQEEEWLEIIDKMILAFELHSKKDIGTSEHQNEIKEGLSLFAEYYECLWW